MNIGNNLTVESLQDTYYANSKDNSWSANASFNIDGDTNKKSGSLGGGGSSTRSNTDSQWVNNQTSIIADNKVNIKVGTKEEIKDNNGNIIQEAGEGKTDIKGAVINSNSDNLTIDTKDLTHSNIQDTYYTETKGSNFSTTIGTDPDKGKTNIAPMGSTTIGFKDMGSEKEQETRATIGNGNIIVKDTINNQTIIVNEDGTTNTNSLLMELNRDASKSQEITKDMITGALDGSMTVDNRLFTKEGRESIAKDFKNFGKNTHLALSNAAEAGYILGGKYVNKALGLINNGLSDLALVGNGLQTLISPIVGTSNYFFEDRSFLSTKDGKVANATAGMNYYGNGIQNSKDDLKDVVNMKNTDTVARYNPESSPLADTIESGWGKLFNILGLGGTSRMSRLETNDFYERKDMSNVNNVSHSQGTIIMTGALQLYADRYGNNSINPNQTFVFTGPAVNEGQTKNVVGEAGISIKKEDHGLIYEHDKKDPINYMTNINRIPEGIKNGINGELDFKSHTFINNYNYYKHLLLDYNNQTPINNK